MKQCPTCQRTYSDKSISFCLADGTLLSAPYPTQSSEAPMTPAPTVVMPSSELPPIRGGGQSTVTAVHPVISSTNERTIEIPTPISRGGQIQVAFTSFFALFAIVGLALYGLPFYYDRMVNEFGWSRAEVTSGNAISKLIVGPLFGFFAGWIVDRFGPRRLMLVGIVMAGGAVVGLGSMNT